MRTEQLKLFRQGLYVSARIADMDGESGKSWVLTQTCNTRVIAHYARLGMGLSRAEKEIYAIACMVWGSDFESEEEVVDV